MRGRFTCDFAWSAVTWPSETAQGSDCCRVGDSGVCHVASVFDRPYDILEISITVYFYSICLTVGSHSDDATHVLNRFFDGLFAVITGHPFHGDRRHISIYAGFSYADFPFDT